MPVKRPYRFALVTHSDEIVDAVKTHVDLEREALEVRIVDLDQAVPTARALLSSGVEVIIGHGGTGALITQKLGHSVVHVPTTYLELFRSVLAARRHGSRIGITAFARPRDGVDLLETHLGVSVRQIVFRSTRELREGVHAAIDAGTTVIVGGGVSRQMAEAAGGHGIVIEPDARNVRQTLAQARAMAAARRAEREQAEQMQTILQMVADGVVGIDGYGRLNFYNRNAEAVLEMPLAPHVGQSLSRVSRELGLIDVLSSGTPRHEQIRKVFGKTLMIDTLPISLDGRVRGAVSLFKETRSIQNSDRKVRERLYARGFQARYDLSDIHGESDGIRRLKEKAVRYAASDAAVLIQGDTGTGKELFAHALHQCSSRHDQPFVAVNCAALTESLLESELFGYEDGAFTGARKGGKIGLFELAGGGTIFLDEIGDISPALQVRLLRVVEAREVMRIGGDRIVPMDARVISASQTDLGSAQSGFRPDLYYRLAVLRLTIPPLCRRPEDIPGLVAVQLARFGHSPECIDGRMMQHLQEHPWPGNVRQLNAFMERYLILLDGRRDPELFFELLSESTGAVEDAPGIGSPAPAPRTLKARLQQVERQIIRETLAHCRYNRKATAEKLGISVNTLWRKLGDEDRS